MVIYPIVLVLSLGGIYYISRKYIKEALAFSSPELKLKLTTMPSVRNDLWVKFGEPTLTHVKTHTVPSILRLFEKLIKRFTIWVSHLESRLKVISSDIHGTAINLEVSEKTPYWQDLGVAKTNGTANADSKKSI